MLLRVKKIINRKSVESLYSVVKLMNISIKQNSNRIKQLMHIYGSFRFILIISANL